jgi:hypothetical protein
MDDRLANAPVGVVEATPEGEVLAANERAAALLGTTPAETVGETVAAAFPRSAAGTLRAAFDGAPPDERSFVEYYPSVDRWLAVDVRRVEDGVVVYVRDRDRRREQRRTIDRLERRLDRMERIDALVGRVLRTVIDADDRDEVARTVCEGLGGTDLYEFAWVGERSPDGDGLRIAAAAGDAPDVREAIAEALGTDGGLPEQRAVAARETVAVQALAEDRAVDRDVRLAAFGEGLQSSVAVPLVYRDTVYGVLGAYSGREGGVDDAERSTLETLGAVAGYAINATRQEDLLFADAVTELTVAVDDGTVPFVAAARAGDCRLSLAGAVPRDDGTVVCYLRADDAVGTVVGTLSAHEAVGADPRVLGDDGDDDDRDGDHADDVERVVEVELDGEAPVVTLLAWGATVADARYTGSGARLTAEVPSDADPRRLVEALDSAFAGTDVVAKSERSRTPETVADFHSDLAERLTDKQLTVLRTAYLSEYFRSPRGSTSEEVGEALDVTGPTVLYHLRKAQRKLLASFFETGDRSRSRRGGEP